MSVTINQAEHYREVRKRLWGKPVVEPVNHTPWPMMWRTPRVDLIWWTPRVWELLGEHQGAMIDISRHRTVKDIAKEICKIHRVSLADLYSENKKKEIARARQHFFYQCALLTKASMTVIGAKCGNRDHSTVLHGVVKHAVTHGLPLPRKDMSSMDYDRMVARRVA